jgi:4-hydroxybenzoate polyprenyltransferase
LSESIPEVGKKIEDDARPQSSDARQLPPLARALRVHQWVKNLLVFVPLVMAHRVTDRAVLIQASLAFVAWCLCASGVYLINDVLDAESDRLHPNKRSRPFAAGAMSKRAVALFVPSLLAPGLAIAFLFLPISFGFMLLVYLGLTTAYSLFLKRLIIVDVLVLAGLYSLRVLSGGLATGIEVSPWLLAFSMFLFLSLAFVKRYTESRGLGEDGHINGTGRGYTFADGELLKSFGTSSGYLSVLVLALYINGSREVMIFYSRPSVLWLIGPCLLYWITRVWFLASRGKLHDDPVVFTVKDPVSYGLGIIVALLLVIAS